MSEKNVVSIEDRIPKLKQERKKKTNRRLIFYLSLFFILISIVVYLQSPLSHIQSINLSGNNHISDEQIHHLSDITKGDNFWRVNHEEVEEQIVTHPEIKAVQVAKQFPTTIDIAVEEFDRIGYVKEEDHYLPLLENGKRLTTNPVENSIGDAPLLLSFEQQLYLQEMSKELAKLPNSIVDLISEIRWNPTEGNPYQIEMYMNDGYQVETTIRSFSETMKTYPSITAQLEPEIKGVIKIGTSGAVFNPYESEITNQVEETGESS
ncbi:cell division protein FtsQ/DivIB [Aquibacillus sediminis]|uniref:cell division protein FtsQ/DivIB n=1 Tax=Aquibacillus sediminis TaxID=2574734 RepID=UPI001108B3E9|nr:FtsQ-type POTRA domain-containing protein [Aquibacillus sediminis]